MINCTLHTKKVGNFLFKAFEHIQYLKSFNPPFVELYKLINNFVVIYNGLRKGEINKNLLLPFTCII